MASYGKFSRFLSLLLLLSCALLAPTPETPSIISKGKPVFTTNHSEPAAIPTTEPLTAASSEGANDVGPSDATKRTAHAPEDLQQTTFTSVPTISSVSHADSEIVKDEIRIGQPWNVMLALPDSRQRKGFETEFIKPMADHLKTIPGFIDVKVTYVRAGSIIVGYNVRVISRASTEQQYKNTMKSVYQSGSLGKHSVSRTSNSAAYEEEDGDGNGPPKFVIVIVIAAVVLIVFGVGLFLLSKRRRKTNIQAQSQIRSRLEMASMKTVESKLPSNGKSLP